MVVNGGTPWNKGLSKKIKCTCKCGKTFFISPSRKETAKFCSQKCYHKYSRHDYSKGKHWKLSNETKKKQGLHQIGEKNHNWKGGITNPRKNKEEKVWSRAVKKRDKFCVICGSDKKLESHHLNGFNKFPKERYIIENGVTLCNKHHEEFHKQYGYGKNTKKQFEEFITERIESIEKVILKKSIIYNISLEGDRTFYANGILTHNTPPHIIKPKDKQALHWGGKNGPIVKEVHHPGTRPNPFIRNTIKNKIGKIIQEEIVKVISKI